MQDARIDAEELPIRPSFDQMVIVHTTSATYARTSRENYQAVGVEVSRSLSSYLILNHFSEAGPSRIQYTR